MTERETNRPVRPADAAGLILLRQGRGAVEVLMGRRQPRAKFLPDIYVFPGGRVDRADRAPSGYREALHEGVAAELRRAAPRREPTAYLRAAIRETFEETGLLLGLPDSRAQATTRDPRPRIWQAFAEAGLRPHFEGLDLVGRAITPTYSPRRFNTRFFLADGAQAAGRLGGDGELLDLAWRPVSTMWSMNIVDVTEFMLREALGRWERGHRIGREPPPLYSYVGEDHPRIRR